MKLLFVTWSVPYPPLSGSAMILLNQIRELGTRHTVDLISFRNGKTPDELGDLSRWCHHIELVDRPPKWRRLANVLTSLADPVPLRASALRSPEMTAVIGRYLAQGDYDAVLFQTLMMGPFRPEWFKGPTIWNLEDPIALKEQRMLPFCPWYSKPLSWERMARGSRYERNYIPQFDCVTFVNEEDCREYRGSFPGSRLDCAPSGIDVNAFSPREDIPRRDGMIVITGNMFHQPNVDAVEYFCRKVFPLICKEVPNATLWLVGARPVKSVSKWSKDSRIKVTGFVPDTCTYLREAMVSVCPVRLRIGTQTKILEALACGTPVVTSSAGNHGIGAISGEHLYVADDPAEFAEDVISLLKRHRWDEFSKNGRRFVVDNFSWGRSARKLEHILEELVAAKTANSVPA
jgi:glycosyltransferase involved in cell wall biosynthesis